MCTEVAETRTTHGHQPSALPTKPLRATTVKLPWSNGRKIGYLLNCWTIASFPMKGPSCWHNTTCTCPLILWYVTGSARKVSRFSSHLKRNRPCCWPHWNKRKASQYGGYRNYIQNLLTFLALVDDGWLACIQKLCEKRFKLSKICKICRIREICKLRKICRIYEEYTQLEYDQVVCDRCTPRAAQKHRHSSRAFTHRTRKLWSQLL